MSRTFLFQTIRFSQTVLIQTIQLSIIIVFVYTHLNVKTVVFQTIQFSISSQFSSIWPIDRTLSGATTPGQSEPGSDGNEGIHRIPQSSSITRTSPSDLFSVLSRILVLGFSPLQWSSQYILQPQLTGQSHLKQLMFFENKIT